MKLKLSVVPRAFSSCYYSALIRMKMGGGGKGIKMWA